MRNALTQAAGQASPTVTRRSFLGSTAGAGAATITAGSLALPAFAAAAPTDPLLAFVTAWEAAIAENAAIARAAPDDEAPNAHERTYVAPFLARAESGDVPVATTAQGAAAALRRVLSWDDQEAQDITMIRAALAFLQGEQGSSAFSTAAVTPYCAAITTRASAPDPIMAAIDHHRAAWDYLSSDLTDDEQAAAGDIEQKAWDDLADTHPNTPDGLAAMANYVASAPAALEYDVNLQRAMRTIAAATSKFASQRRPEMA